MARHRRRLHQLLRELRASARRRVVRDQSRAGVHALVLGRDRRAAGPARTGLARSRELERLSLALAAHDPARTMARGYALVRAPTGCRWARRRPPAGRGRCRLRFHDGSVPARVTDEEQR